MALPLPLPLPLLSANWLQPIPSSAGGDETSIRAGLVLRGAARSDRQPVHLVFLLDISGSMAGERLNSVKRSVQFILELMNANDLISVITYDDDASTLISRTPVTTDEKARISYAVNQLRDRGCTNMSAALLQARQVLAAPPPAAPAAPSQGGDADGAAAPVPRPYKEGIVFLTDGHANRGVSDKDSLLEIVQRTLTDFPGISISTIAYGEDHNTDLLSSMGRAGGGSYNLVNNLESIATVFGDVLGGLTSVAAQNVVVHLPFECTPMTQYATKQAEDLHYEIRIGDLYAEAELTVLFEAPPSSVPRIRVVYDDMATLNHEDQMVTIEPLLPLAQPPKILEVAVFRYQVSAILREMAKRPASAELTALKARAEAALAALKALPYAAENLIQMMIDDLERVLETADHMERGGYVGTDMTTAMAQHSAYLGMGRGMRSMMPEVDNTPSAAHAAAGGGGGRIHRNFGSPVLGPTGALVDPDDDSDAGTPVAQDPTTSLSAPPAPLTRTRTARVDNYSSPFATRLQSTASSAMRVMSTQAEPPPSPPLAPALPSPPAPLARTPTSS